MPEDPLRVREELAFLKKEVIRLSGIKNDLDKKIKEFHDEEIRYLNEIPGFKIQVENGRNRVSEINKDAQFAKIALGDIKKELGEYQRLVDVQRKSLEELKSTQEKIIKETSIINEEIKQRYIHLRNDEDEIVNKSKDLSSKEFINKNTKTLLDKREYEILKKEQDLSVIESDLKKKSEEYKIKIEDHLKRLDIFSEKKRFHAEDEELLKNKLTKADKLIKDNIDIKSGIVVKSNKLDKEILAAQSKQESLDRRIADLKNQENRLKIIELKIQKMAKDSGLEKEIKELQEAIK